MMNSQGNRRKDVDALYEKSQLAKTKNLLQWTQVSTIVGDTLKMLKLTVEVPQLLISRMNNSRALGTNLSARSILTASVKITNA